MLTIFIHRLIQCFLLPPFNAVLIIVVGLFFCKLRRTIVIFGCVILYLQATPYVAYNLNRLTAPKAMSVKELSEVKALVILGGGTNNYTKEYNLTTLPNADTLLRIRYAAYLAKKAPDLPIFISGGTVNSQDSEASLIKRSLRNEFGVTNPIYLEPDSKTTRENAKYSSRLLSQYGISKIALVTSASHMYRAQALFKQNGINVIAAPTGFYGLSYTSWPIMWFIPSANAMVTTAVVLHELLGYWYDVEM